VIVVLADMPRQFESNLLVLNVVESDWSDSLLFNVVGEFCFSLIVAEDVSDTV